MSGPAVFAFALNSGKGSAEGSQSLSFGSCEC